MRGCIIIHVVVVGTHAHLSFHSNFEFDARIVDSINEKNQIICGCGSSLKYNADLKEG